MFRNRGSWYDLSEAGERVGRGGREMSRAGHSWLISWDY